MQELFRRGEVPSEKHARRSSGLRPFHPRDVVGLRTSLVAPLPLREANVEPALGITLGLGYATFSSRPGGLGRNAIAPCSADV